LATKSVLITAGPTWVAIDSVRVISNTASGATGILLANKLAKLGARVTLLLGPVNDCCINKKVKIIRYRFFDELRSQLFRELKRKDYGILVHTAAVSDYKPDKTLSGKTASGKKTWQITFVPTEKLINRVKKIRCDIFLVGFKFEPKITRLGLLKEARRLIKESRADLVVANTTKVTGYRAFIMDGKTVFYRSSDKADTVDKLSRLIMEKA
jgi:phosphopantothenoylcysteine decarboxylase/phosphopantothenate--cysteine ligase